MKFTETNLKDCYVIDLDRYSDQRGWFSRTFCINDFLEIGFSSPWVQHNHSYNRIAGTIRGMHYQRLPACETKLIRCIAGRVYDVAVDLRPHSPTFLKWHAEELSKDNLKMIFIPEGFAHGFQTLTDDAELLYYHSNTYQPEYESGLNCFDKILNINWPVQITEISDRDKHHPLINSKFEGVNKK